MALQFSTTLDTGISCPEAYARIQQIKHAHSETTVDVQTWANAAARQDGKQIIRQASYIIPWADTVSLTSAYVALKAFPEFQGAIDV